MGFRFRTDEHRGLIFGLAYLATSAIFFADIVNASESMRRIPDEYETVGGHSLGMAECGSVATGGVSAVRLNPAMLSQEKTYSVGAGWNWPVSGREFYQAGVVDSKTGPVAAGVSYTSAMNDYIVPGSPEAIAEDPGIDSPIKRRVALGFSQSFKLLAIGVGGQFIQGRSVGGEKGQDIEPGRETRGTTLSAGVAALINPQVRIGLSGENISNRKIADMAPQTIRAGLAWILTGGDVTLHLDYRQRERVAAFEGPTVTTSLGFGVAEQEADEAERGYTKPEQMVITSASARVQDFLRLMAGYGQSLGEDERRSLAAGVALVSNRMSLSWTASRPWLPMSETHQAINFGFELSM